MPSVSRYQAARKFKNIGWNFFVGIPIHVEKYDAVGIFSNLLKKINCISILYEGGHPSLISDSKLL